MVKNKILYVICVAYIVAGWSVYTTPPTSLDIIRQADPSITAHTNMFSLHQIGMIFMATSVLAILLILWKKVNLAYAIMTFLLVWWSLLYLVSWSQTGYYQSVYGFVNYALTASLLILCSRIVEMPKGMRESMNSPLPLAELDFKFNHQGEEK